MTNSEVQTPLEAAIHQIVCQSISLPFDQIEEQEAVALGCMQRAILEAQIELLDGLFESATDPDLKTCDVDLFWETAIERLKELKNKLEGMEAHD